MMLLCLRDRYRRIVTFKEKYSYLYPILLNLCIFQRAKLILSNSTQMFFSSSTQKHTYLVSYFDQGSNIGVASVFLKARVGKIQFRYPIELAYDSKICSIFKMFRFTHFLCNLCENMYMYLHTSRNFNLTVSRIRNHKTNNDCIVNSALFFDHVIILITQ